MKYTELQRQARNHPERPPSAVVREVQNCDEAVQAELPEIENIKKTIQRKRLQHLPSNPTNVHELQGTQLQHSFKELFFSFPLNVALLHIADIPDSYKKTLTGENFLLYDSNDDDT